MPGQAGIDPPPRPRLSAGRIGGAPARACPNPDPRATPVRRSDLVTGEAAEREIVVDTTTVRAVFTNRGAPAAALDAEGATRRCGPAPGTGARRRRRRRA